LPKTLSKRLSPTAKYWIFLVGIIGIIFAVIFGSFIASYLNLEPQEQALVRSLSDKLIPFPFLGAVVLIAFICTLVGLLFRNYIIPVLRMAEQTRLITAANPDFRIKAEGARELVTLASMINESADAFQKLQRDVDSRIHNSNRAVRQERNRLAALMSELPYGVVVCNLDGMILLYNRLATEMLTVQGGEQGGAVGLGRSVFGVLDREPLVHALEIMNHAFEHGQAQPSLGLMTRLCGSRFIRVNLAPVSNDDNSSLTGFVLSLEDITGEVRANNERDHLLQTMIDALQSSLGRLYRQISDDGVAPKTDAEGCRHHRQAIASLASDLEEQLAMARRLYSEHQHAYGKRENVLGDTLLQLIARNLDERFSLRVEIAAGPAVWLKIDSYGIVQALTNLAGRLAAEYSISALELSIDGAAAEAARLSVSWASGVVPSDTVRNWVSSPLFMNSEGAPDSAAAIALRHDSEFRLIEAEDASCRGISIDLPGALETTTVGLHASVPSRPVSFEFDLFHQPLQEAFGEVPLRKLTFVAFDTETTGLKPSEGDEIIQLGAVRIVNGRLLHEECLDQLVDPQRPVPQSSVAVHGIDPALLPSQPVITEVLPRFHAFAAGAVLVAHNAAFDMRFLQIKEAAMGLRFDNPVLDTLLLSSIVHPNLEGHSLDAIAERFNLTIIGRHTALGDALVTAGILLKLIPLLEAQGITTLAQAIDASARSRFARIDY
jgi:DNA polymerase-3 subunit epsilon